MLIIFEKNAIVFRYLRKESCNENNDYKIYIYMDKTIFYLDFILLSFYSQFVIYLDEYLTLVIVYSYIEMDIHTTSKSWNVN